MHGQLAAASADVHWTAIIVAASAAASVLGGVIIVIWRKARPRLLSASRFLDDWHGEPERRGSAGQLISEARPGVLERLTAVEQKVGSVETDVTGLKGDMRVLRGDANVLRDGLAEVRAQLKPDGGTSVYDKVTRIDVAVGDARQS